ncbi:hypothetical protein MNB_SM-4-846 [hydrothermal vent metagenome]|uniref:Uncharacterized protein n=1 Tax=hydrothermal vent metagenome TaxID=652676 RepID=A0A1W1CUV6_9ZZZZ
MIHKIFTLLLFSSLALASDFEVDTLDVLIKDKTSQESNRTTPIEDDSLQKSDPLLSITKKKNETKNGQEEASLLEKIRSQMAEKEKNKSRSKKETKKNKNQNYDNDIVTSDPLLDEI